MGQNPIARVAEPMDPPRCVTEAGIDSWITLTYNVFSAASPIDGRRSDNITQRQYRRVFLRPGCSQHSVPHAGEPHHQAWHLHRRRSSAAPPTRRPRINEDCVNQSKRLDSKGGLVQSLGGQVEQFDVPQIPMTKAVASTGPERCRTAQSSIDLQQHRIIVPIPAGKNSCDSDAGSPVAPCRARFGALTLAGSHSGEAARISPTFKLLIPVRPPECNRALGSVPIAFISGLGGKFQQRPSYAGCTVGES